MDVSFVHLKVHSEYSICDSVLRIAQIVAETKSQGIPAVALTDHMNVFATVKFYQKARSAGLKPLIGADLLVDRDGRRFLITVLCKNTQGYLHLSELLSLAYVEGQDNDGVAKVQWSWLLDKREGLIVLSGGLQGNVGQAIDAGEVDKAGDLLREWRENFPAHFYVELSRTERANEENYIQAILPLVSELGLPVVATHDVRFLAEADFEAHEARVCIQSGYVLDDTKRPKNYSEQQYLCSAQTMQERFKDLPEALVNTVEIAKRCSLELSLGQPSLPRFPVPEGTDEAEYLRQQSFAGLERLWPTLTSGLDKKAYEDRLNIELDVIIRMEFPGYFLIVADFIQWAKSQSIPVGPGRGSGAGSLVAYCLQITMLDPLEHELLFERFLNPERVSMPDFDVDFCMDRRDEVIAYVAQRYGQPAVSQIITYGSMAAKAVIRDVGRVLSLPYGFVDKIAKLIPFELGITLDKALEQEEQLANRYKSENEVRTLIDLAKKDLDIAIKFSETLGVPISLAIQAEEIYAAAQAEGRGKQDWTAVFDMLQKNRAPKS